MQQLQEHAVRIAVDDPLDRAVRPIADRVRPFLRQVIQLSRSRYELPGDRIVGLRKSGEPVEVHTIDCLELASGIDADWLDLAWGEGSDGGSARLSVILRDIPGALGTMSGILGAKHANIINLQLAHRDGSFQTFHLDIEVHDLAHLHAIIAALRDAEPVSSVERI